MSVPETLPQRVFLLACRPDKNRVVSARLGPMLRAAALADLHLSRHLTDENGRPAAAGRQRSPDPVLEALREEVAASRPRKWQSWIGRRHRPTIRAVRRQLGDAGWVRLEPHRILGLFPTTRVTVRDPRVRKELLGRVHSALRGAAGRIDAADVALVAIVAEGRLDPALDRRARRDHKRRLKELTELSGPVGPALRKAIQAADAAASAAG